MTRVLRLLAVLLLLPLAGCLDLDQTLQLNADGSGQLQVSCTWSPEAVTILNDDLPLRPPLDGFDPDQFPLTQTAVEQLAKRLGVTAEEIAVKDLATGGRQVSFTFVFKDLLRFREAAQDLFDVQVQPMAQADPKGLQLRIIGLGMANLMRRHERARPGGRVAEELATARLLAKGANYRLTVQLPAAAVTTNAHQQEGSTLRWAWTAADLVAPTGKEENPKLAVPQIVVADNLFTFAPAPAAAAYRIPEATELKCVIDRVEIENRSFGRGDQLSVAAGGQIELPPGTMPIGMKPAAVAVATTLAGDDLRRPRFGFGPSGDWRPQPGMAPRRLPLVIPPMAVAEGRIDGLNILKGSVAIRFATGVKQLRVTNLAEWFDKPLAPEQLGSLRIQLTQDGENLSVMIDNDSRELVKEVQLEGADGKRIPLPRPEINPRGRWLRMRYPVTLPENAVLTLYVYDGVKEVEAGFLLENLSFAGAKQP